MTPPRVCTASAARAADLECLYQHGNDEFLVHETFLGDTGDLVFTVWPRALCRMDWTTREIRTIVEYNAWHIAPDRRGPARALRHQPSGRGLADYRCLHRRAAATVPERIEQSGQSMASLAVRAGRGFRAGAQCLELDGNAVDTVYGPQWSHPHPSWSTNETKVAFASDRTGTAQVYVVEVESGVEEARKRGMLEVS